MGIDRIGKGNGVPPANGSHSPGKAGESGKVFEVPAGKQAASVGAVGASPLEQLKAGKIDFDHYVQAKVDEATAHLHGRVSPVQLDSIRSMLRDQLASDPALTDLVRQATGHAPEPPPEE